MPATLQRAATMAEYARRRAERAGVVSRNASRRMRGMSGQAEALPVLLARPLVPVAYSDGGTTYEGVLPSAEDCPEGMTVRWEEAVR